MGLIKIILLLIPGAVALNYFAPDLTLLQVILIQTLLFGGGMVNEWLEP